MRLNSLVSPYVLNLDKKHPDYIYVKYHIYKESMQQQRHEELENEVFHEYKQVSGHFFSSSLNWKLLLAISQTEMDKCGCASRR